MISESEIKEALINTLVEIQKMNGKVVSVIDGQTRPFSDLDGFDSLTALETSLLLSEYLGIDIAPDVTLYADHGHILSVDEIVERIYQQIN